MAVVAANRLLVALRTARKILDERRARKTDRGVRALEEAREELVEIAAEDLLEVNGLSLQTAILAMENGKESEAQLTDWTELQHWTLPELQVLVAAYGGGSVSSKRLESTIRAHGACRDRRHDGKDNGELGEHRKVYGGVEM